MRRPKHERPQVELVAIWGERVAARREELKLTQAQLADLCDVSQQTISKIERGEIEPGAWLKISLTTRLGHGDRVEKLFPWRVGQPRAAAS